MQLRDIQEGFKNTMIDPAELDQKDGAFRNLFIKDGISLENRMKVYRNNVVRGLSDTVMAAYPVTEKLVGKEFLETATREYVIHNLPERGNLNLYGATFPEFLESYEPAKDLPYLPDVARMEWACEEAYYALDDTPLALEALQEIEQDKLPFVKLTFRDPVRLLKSPYPLDKIYDFCKTEDAADKTLDISSRGANILVYRPEYTVETRRLHDGAFAFLIGLYQGKTILEATEKAVETDHRFDLAVSLQKYLERGIFKDFTLSTQENGARHV